MPYQEPEYLPWDGRRVPLTFIAGYLGAGKTSLINELLRTTRRPIAVLVNDVGEVNIDARLIRRTHGDTIELTDGCVCCSLSEGFGVAIDELRAREQPPDHVVVELSGVADPSRVLPWARSAGFRLDGVVTLVDIEQFDERVSDPLVGPALAHQLAAADIVLATKTDLVDDQKAREVLSRVADLTNGAPVVTSSNIGLASLLEIGGRDDIGTPALIEPSLFDPHVTDLIELPCPIGRAEIDTLLDGLGPNVVRAKGIAEDYDGDRWLIQVVGRRRDVSLLPAAEQEPPTGLVVISVPS